MIVEKLIGKSWGDNIKEKFFVFFGMMCFNVFIFEFKKSKNVVKGY